jgi:Flp pilus assembly protein TadG
MVQRGGHPVIRLRNRRDTGAAAILTVILMSVVLIGLASIVVELGLARDTRRQAQNAADSAALAAGNAFVSGGSVTTAIASAKSLAAKNFGTTTADWASCTDGAALSYHPDTSCISFNPAASPSQVRVLVPFRPVVTPLGGVFGNQKVDVQAVAVVGLTGSALGPCGLCVIGQANHDLQNGDIVVSGANVVFNGNLSANRNGSITVNGGGQINLDKATPTKGTYSPAPNQNQPAVPDPLAGMAMPDYSGLTAETNACSAGPGIYDSLNLPNGPCTLQPGLYVIYGPNHPSGNTAITALGVTLYFVCATGPTPRACNANEGGGDLLMTGNATLHITAPTSGPLAGLAAVSDRNNTAEIGWRGNGTNVNTGTVYFKSGTFDYRGNGAGLCDDSLIVVGDLDFSGNPSALHSTYTQTNNVVITAPSMGLTL